MRRLQADMARAMRAMISNGVKIQELIDRWRPGEFVSISAEFREALETAKRFAGVMDKRQ